MGGVTNRTNRLGGTILFLKQDVFGVFWALVLHFWKNIGHVVRGWANEIGRVKKNKKKRGDTKAHHKKKQII